MTSAKSLIELCSRIVGAPASAIGLKGLSAFTLQTLLIRLGLCPEPLNRAKAGTETLSLEEVLPKIRESRVSPPDAGTMCSALPATLPSPRCSVALGV